jgi:hypothetical protein
MATLTNSFQNCELLNLGYGPKGRGPFVVRQIGSPPGSVTFEKDSYLLRHDGTWVLNFAVFALPEKEQDQFLYQSSAQVMEMLDALTGDPIVQSGTPAGKSREELKAAAAKTFTGMAARIRNAKPATGP